MLTNKIIRETEKNYYFFNQHRIYRTVDKDDNEAKLLIKCNIPDLIEKMFNKKMDENKLTNLLARLKPGATISTLERYLSPESWLSYRVLKETKDGECFYFDRKGIFTETPYMVHLLFPINVGSFIRYGWGLHIEDELLEKIINELQLGDTFDDFENLISSYKSSM